MSSKPIQKQIPKLVCNFSKLKLSLFTAPEIFSGHTAGIRHVLFFRNDTHLISCADDKTLRVWDKSNKQVNQRYTLTTAQVNLHFFSVGSSKSDIPLQPK